MGNVDAGKSTLIGTLKSNVLDNGRGSSRQLVMKHRHELETGRTSSPITHLVGFNEDGSICVGRSLFPKDAHRVVSLLDVAGHEKYLKNTIQAMSQGMIDHALVLVNARKEPNQMTVHHLNLASSLGIPIIMVMTKVSANEPCDPQYCSCLTGK
jgi:GTPase